jgi:glycosyltransferase involved in cell wall biosynthesis
MVVFITSLKRGAIRNHKFKSIFWETIASVSAQTVSTFKILVVADGEDAQFLADDRFEVVEVSFDQNFDPKCRWFLEAGGRATHSNILLRIDKGAKYVVGVNRARYYEPDYIVFFDCDDLISKFYVDELLNISPARGWVCTRGYMLNNVSYEISVVDGFNYHCGSCFAVKAEMLDFPSFIGELNQNAILERFGAQYVTRALGSHCFLDHFFELEPMRRPLIVYRVGHGFNDSGSTRCKGQRSYVTQEIYEEFSMVLFPGV